MMRIIYLTLWSYHLECTTNKTKNYIPFGAKSVVFCVKLQILLKILFSSCVNNFPLEWSIIGIPVDENKLGD